ncbi:beta-lactamase/transpeptidase-like protein [Meredithblackwellia eburnea MCA 4105]
MMGSPKISQAGAEKIRETINQHAQGLAGIGCVVSSEDGPLFEYYTGKKDVLSDEGEQITNDTVMFFASTTKLLTSVAVLQLVDRGVLALSSPVSKFLPQLQTPLHIFTGLDFNGKAQYRSTSTEITVAQMLNQSSGFGAEFEEKVTAWKSTLKEGDKGKGFVNSCKVDNLVHTPIVEEPGALYQYGNSAEWLSLLVQNATGEDYETYMQKNVFGPLGMSNTTFYPLEGKFRNQTMPLRWINTASGEFEVFTSQQPGMLLPREKQDIEYPVGGGGVYSNPTDYIKLIRHLLFHLNHPDVSSPILSSTAIRSLFERSLPTGSIPGLIAKVGEWYGCEADELDWSTGMCLYMKNERRGGFGRRKGSAGWMGAGGSEYFIDRETGVAICFATNVMPSNTPRISEMKLAVEKAIYEALE